MTDTHTEESLIDDLGIPDETLVAFHVHLTDLDKGRRMRAALAADAPEGAAESIGNLPINAEPGIRKNRMYAITENGVQLFEINLKTGYIRTLSHDHYAPVTTG